MQLHIHKGRRSTRVASILTAAVLIASGASAAPTAPAVASSELAATTKVSTPAGRPPVAGAIAATQRKRYRWVAPKHRSSAALQVVWAACGVFSAEDKVVRVYDRVAGQRNTLRCGPRFTSTPRSGYRHIKWRHQTDFESQAAGTVQNWRDIADLSMAENSLWPTTRLLQSNGRWCSSVRLNKIDLRTGAVKKRKYFHLVTEADGNVWTAYPARKGCKLK